MLALGVICARAGSKGLPGKNFIPFNGEPLINRSVREALKSKRLNDLVVSTNCRYSAALVEGLVEVIQRPDDMSLDTSPIHEAVCHALNEKQDCAPRDYDVVVCMQNSQPFRRAEDIDNALMMLDELPDIDTVMSVVSYEHVHPELGYIMDGDQLQSTAIDRGAYRRQDRTKILYMSGVVFAMRCASFLHELHVPCGKIAPLEISPYRAIDIHNWRDWRLAQAVERIDSDEYME